MTQAAATLPFEQKPKLKKKEPFVVKINEQDVTLAVERPSQEKLAEAQETYNKTFRRAIDSTAIVRARIDKVMREQNLWDDNKQKEYDALNKKLLDGEKRLYAGGIKLNEAYWIAIRMIFDRAKKRNLDGQRTGLDSNTAEGQAENARFNHLVSVCTVYNDTGKPYFNSYKDYLERSDDPIAVEAATKLAYIIYGLDPNHEANQPENKFLRKWGFMDDKLRLIRKSDKKFITYIDVPNKEDPTKESELVERLVDSEGRFINEQNQFVDRDGNLLDKEGNYISTTQQPFLDEEGNPVVEPKQEAEHEEPVTLALPAETVKKKTK